jgi:hypothetical protein
MNKTSLTGGALAMVCVLSQSVNSGSEGVTEFDKSQRVEISQAYQPHRSARIPTRVGYLSLKISRLILYTLLVFPVPRLS